ncbi:response regulator transcription factor [Alteromonas sp. C1M14]|uniref:response regulator transcription factor n=1 Tax=Alteromonas sp. C1M14 TaxID=2841567 RepID=UPI001C08C7D3|nr:response regulator transcription factor [Alteromonas sp. C1M14]MBU2978195.1 response regulator transcription factor [Alteromonas sp. C1M14]
MKLLIIEDSISLRRSLRLGLKNLGFAVDETGDGAQGLTMAVTGEYELIILDIMLPSVDGITLVQTLRTKQLSTRILILSAKHEPEDRVNAILTGADDYLTKPFSFDELHARLINLMRRGELKTTSDVIYVDNLALNLQLKLLKIGNTIIDLTPNEYRIVECLFNNQNKVFSAEKLSNHIAGQYDLVSKNTIEAHISSARKKVRVAGGELPIQTKRGFGYMVQG